MILHPQNLTAEELFNKHLTELKTVAEETRRHLTETNKTRKNPRTGSAREPGFSLTLANNVMRKLLIAASKDILHMDPKNQEKARQELEETVKTDLFTSLPI